MDTPPPLFNINHRYSTGSHRNSLKPYTHIVSVKATLVWETRSASLKQLTSFHNQRYQVASFNYSIPSACKATPPRSSNRKVQKHIDTLAKVEYHQSRDADRIPLASESGQTPTNVNAGYLQALSIGYYKDQMYFSKLKDKVGEDAMELYGLRNLPG